ncbi:MAG TPA: MFS transporter [Streptosporangiaceae bacterium]|nr:MFS transporter [Streptosporangiaceae bacterium]
MTDSTAGSASSAGLDGTAGAGGVPFRWTRRHVLALAVLCLAALLDTIDVTVVNVAMPAIRNALHFSEGGLAWMVNAYMVPFGGFLLFGGRAGDLLGRRRVLLAGTAVFTLASLGSALAPGVGVMITTRALEGVAAAFVVPMTLAMLSTVFPAGPARNRAFAIWGGISAAAGTLGLIAGGLLVSSVGWRWIFFINIPVGLLVLAAATRLLPADRAGDRSRGQFDLIGALSVTAGSSLLAYAVVQTGSHPWGSARTIALLAGAAVLLGYFVWHERFGAAAPLMPTALWRSRPVTGANLVSALLSSAVFAMFYSTTLYMQQVLGYSALRTGLAYLPLGLSILIAAGLAPVLISRIGVRLVAAAGAVLSLAGLVLFTGIPAHGQLLTDIVIPSVIVGLGGGLMLLSTTIAAMSGVPAEHHGVASALLNVSRQLGGALGLAAISTIIASVAARSAGPLPVVLTAGFRVGFTVSAALVGLAAVAALALLPDDGRGQRVNLVELQAHG